MRRLMPPLPGFIYICWYIPGVTPLRGSAPGYFISPLRGSDYSGHSPSRFLQLVSPGGYAVKVPLRFTGKGVLPPGKLAVRAVKNARHGRGEESSAPDGENKATPWVKISALASRVM